MKSYQNAALLQNLYRLKSLGFEYCDPIVANTVDIKGELPNDIAALQSMVAQCHLCDLSKHRKQTLSGRGHTGARVMIVDAFVSMAQDEEGDYFAGRAGTSLAAMVEKVLLLPRSDIYLTHIVKCRASGDGIPTESECNSCRPYWKKEIELVNPEIVITLGPEAYRLLSGEGSDFERLRGHPIDFDGRRLVPLYHPAFLLRNPSFKKETMRDLQNIKGML